MRTMTRVELSGGRVECTQWFGRMWGRERWTQNRWVSKDEGDKGWA